MDDEERPRKLNREQARLDPAAVFAGPEEVRDHGELDVDEKIEILKRWAYDDAETNVAREEGMPGDSGDDELQQRIFLALEALGGDAVLEPTGPTKQRGMFDTRRRPARDPEV